jgi:hypothetical protein
MASASWTAATFWPGRLSRAASAARKCGTTIIDTRSLAHPPGRRLRVTLQNALTGTLLSNRSAVSRVMHYGGLLHPVELNMVA